MTSRHSGQVAARNSSSRRCFIPSAPSATSSSHSSPRRVRWAARILGSSTGSCSGCVPSAVSIASLYLEPSKAGRCSMTGAAKVAKTIGEPDQWRALRTASAARRRASRPTGSIRSPSKPSSSASWFANCPDLPVPTRRAGAKRQCVGSRRPAGALLFRDMSEPVSMPRACDSQGEQVRRLRLRADGQRPLATNLLETIALTRKLFELRDAASRAR